MKAWTAIICLLMLSVPYVSADTWLSYGYSQDYDYDYLRSDRTSREHRDAGDVDDWIERGNATVTSSPLPGFEDGVRLSAWASGSGDDSDYDFALASAVYHFEIPDRAEYAEIKIRYHGEASQADFEDYESIAGRVWVRNTRKERENRSYGEDDGSDTLYGDTFVLRARRRSETLKIPTADHTKDGYMELHLVVDGGGMLDVEYLDVSTYRRQPEMRVIHRYVRDYDWRPWNNYSYAYFYNGPCYYATDYDYYIMWEFPLNHHRYLGIRRHFHDYWVDYRRRYPQHHTYRASTHVDVNVNVRVNAQRPLHQRRVRHLAKWTDTHERTREVYVRTTKSTSSAARMETSQPEVRTRVRSTIQTNRSKPVLSERPIRERTSRSSITLNQTRTRSSQTTPERRSSTSVERSTERSSERSSTLKRRTHSARPDEPEQRVRITPGTSTSRSQSATRQSQSVRTQPQRSQPSSAVQQRREELERRIEQRKSTSSSTRVRSSTSSSSSRTQVKQASQPTQTKSDDDDEDEKEEQRQTNTQRTKRRK